MFSNSVARLSHRRRDSAFGTALTAPDVNVIVTTLRLDDLASMSVVHG